MGMSTLRVVPDQPSRLRDRVATEVRANMARARMTQTDLAVVLGLTQSAVSKRLRGKIAFSVDELELVADALGVDPATLLGGRGDTPQPPRPTTCGLFDAAFTPRSDLGSSNAMRTAVPHSGPGWAPATPVAA